MERVLWACEQLQEPKGGNRCCGQGGGFLRGRVAQEPEVEAWMGNPCAHCWGSKELVQK